MFKTTLLAILLCISIAAQVVAADSVADYNNRGNDKQASGDLDDAMADYNRAIKLDPKDAFAYYNRGIARKAKGDLNGALADYNRAIQLDPNNASAYCNRGAVRKAKGDSFGAMADYNRAIKLDPKNAYAYCNRGLEKKMSGDLDGAMADYNRAIVFDPRNGYAYNRRGNVKKAKGDLNGAIADYNRAIALDPNDPWPHNDIAWLLATSADSSVRNGAKAVEHARTACELNHWKDVTIDTLAAAYAESGDFAQAVKWQSQYTEANLSDKRARERLALYQKHQPYRQALKK